MRRLKLFIFLSIILPASLMSQLELRLGGGLNSSQFTSDWNNTAFREGWGYQFGADLQIGNSWYFQTGLHFELLENESGGTDPIFPVGEIRIQRLRAPLYIGHRFFDRSALLNMRIYTGPNASILINSELSESLNLNSDDFNRTLVGWNLGAGLDLAFLFVDVGYMFGLNQSFIGGDSNVSNNLFFANAGIRVKF